MRGAHKNATLIVHTYLIQINQTMLDITQQAGESIKLFLEKEFL